VVSASRRTHSVPKVRIHLAPPVSLRRCEFPAATSEIATRAWVSRHLKGTGESALYTNRSRRVPSSSHLERSSAKRLAIISRDDFDDHLPRTHECHASVWYTGGGVRRRLKRGVCVPNLPSVQEILPAIRSFLPANGGIDRCKCATHWRRRSGLRSFPQAPLLQAPVFLLLIFIRRA
jgi:hypothetical protein